MLALRFLLDRYIIKVVVSHCNGTNSFVGGRGGMWFSLYLSTWTWVKIPYGEYLEEQKVGEREEKERLVT